jgi:hypothetical protein
VNLRHDDGGVGIVDERCGRGQQDAAQLVGGEAGRLDFVQQRQRDAAVGTDHDVGRQILFAPEADREAVVHADDVAGRQRGRAAGRGRTIHQGRRLASRKGDGHQHQLKQDSHGFDNRGVSKRIAMRGPPNCPSSASRRAARAACATCSPRAGRQRSAAAARSMAPGARVRTWLPRRMREPVAWWAFGGARLTSFLMRPRRA